jgi:drug/metabolite transporter (DMT)-like permease
MRRLEEIDCDATSANSQWLIGASMNITGSVMINLGTNLMKLGHNQEAEAASAAPGQKTPAATSPRSDLIELGQAQTGELHEPSPNKPEKKSKWWRIGMTTFIIGNFLNFASFSFANQSLLAALGSVQFVTNVAFGRFVLHLAISRKILIGTAIIVLANVVIVNFTQDDGDGCTHTYSSTELANMYGETNYIVYLSLCAVAGVGSYAIFRYLDARPKPPMNILGICYVISSAVIGTQSVTLCKSLSTLIRVSLTGNNQFTHFFTYVILVCTICTAVFWVKRMNGALKKFDALFIIPVLQVFWTSLSIVGGGIYYKEFEVYSTRSTVIFILSMVAIFFGVYLLAPDEEGDNEKEALTSGMMSTTSDYSDGGIVGDAGTSQNDNSPDEPFQGNRPRLNSSPGDVLPLVPIPYIERLVPLPNVSLPLESHPLSSSELQGGITAKIPHIVIPSVSAPPPLHPPKPVSD